jgi:hypothetical protein
MQAVTVIPFLNPTDKLMVSVSELKSAVSS